MFSAGSDFLVCIASINELPGRIRAEAKEFIRALPDSGKVFIRALTAAGANKATNFVLSGVSKIREKIGRACGWSSTSDDTTGIDYSAAETPIEGSRRRTAADPGSAPIPY